MFVNFSYYVVACQVWHTMPIFYQCGSYNEVVIVGWIYGLRPLDSYAHKRDGIVKGGYKHFCEQSGSLTRSA